MPSVDSTGKRLNGSETARRAAERRAQRAQLAALAPEIAATLPEMRFTTDSGSKRATGKAPSADETPHPIECPEPPTEVVKIVAWAARIQAQAALLAAAKKDPVRVRAVSGVIKALAKIKHAAADSEKACRALQRFRGQEISYTDPLYPPVEDVGLAAWAMISLAHLLRDTCREPGEIDEGATSHRARTLALLEAIQPQAAIDAVAQELAEEVE